MILDYILFALEALLPAAVAAIFYVIRKYTKFDELGFWIKQTIYGVAFGGIAIIGTHFGIPMAGAVVNARDAAVITAGLAFGTPAGFIAGFIGGAERVLVPIIDSNVGSFTTIACSISTFLAGVAAGLIRKFAFNNRRPGVLSAFFIGLVVETFHLFMVFVTNVNDHANAFRVVKACTAPMLIANSLGVMISIFVVNYLKLKRDFFKKPDTRKLVYRFTMILSCLTFLAFTLSEIFVFKFQDKMSSKQTDNLLTEGITDIEDEVDYKVNSIIAEKCLDIKMMYGSELNNPVFTEDMVSFANANAITEINIVDSNNILQYTNVDTTVYTDYIGFNFANYEQSKEFVQLNDPNYDIGNKHSTIVQDFRIMGLSEGIDENPEYRKYASIRTDFGFIEIGYNEFLLSNLTIDVIYDISQFRRVGENGSVLIIDNYDNLISKAENFDFELVADSPVYQIINKKNIDETFETTLTHIRKTEKGTFEPVSVDYYARYSYSNGYHLISLLPKSDAMLMRNISVYINTFLEIIVFGLVYVTIYTITDKIIIERLKKTNVSLEKITKGDLKETVDGGTTSEFVELANGINTTVNALEGYIDEANRRIDEELALAKAIQTAVLPSTFPAFPDRKEFDVHASMHAAKQVGGDFYDFYFSNSDTFHITIADVSGKGIPAALFMMRAKSVLKSLTQTNMPINEVFMKGNDSLCTGNEAGMFVTAWSATINLNNGTLSFANGGHNPPVIKRANGKFEFLKAPVNLVLAAMSGMPYGKNEIKLEKGDIVYLYTDGVTEGVNQQVEQFGEQRLLDTLNSREFASCKEICDFVYEECVKFADGAAQFDDITMLAFKYNGK